MRRTQWMVAGALVVGVTIGLLGGRMLSAQPSPNDKILQRAELAGCPGMEAVVTYRELPAGGESGKHKQSGGELVYIQQGAVVLEVEGKEPVTVKAGEAFTTPPGAVHNVKNASSDSGGSAIAFYVVKKGATMEDLAEPATN